MHSPQNITFNSQNASKLIHDSVKLSLRFQKLIQMPVNQIKANHLKYIAENGKQAVKAIVDKNTTQNDLFRRLEQEDLLRRDKMLSKIQNKIQKINLLKNKNLRKISEDFHKINQKFFKKHQQHQYKDIQFGKQCELRSNQLKTQLSEFYQNQLVKQSQQWKRLRSLKTCHGDASRMISKRENLKYYFSIQTDKQIDEDYIKNGPKLNPLLEIRKRKRSQRQKKVTQNFQINLENRQNHFIQTYASDVDAGNRMQQFKQLQFKRTSKRIRQKTKVRRQKWSINKMQIDHYNTITPQRCIQKMDQTIKSSFKMTMTNSTFHSTCKSWFDKNNLRKQELRQIKNRKDENILSRHIDTTRVNKGEDQLNNSFLDLKMKAGFNAKQFL